MTRHSKNATAGPTYTYHEKHKDSKQSGYGSKDVRMNKDAIKDFDCCSLSLQPCKNPVITPDGYLYDKEAIIEYILHQKTDNAKKMKLYEQHKNKQVKELKELAEIEAKEKYTKFMKIEGKFVQSESKEKSSEASVSNMDGERSTKLPSFWVPNMTPMAKGTEAPKKPDNKVYCPMSNKPITLRDLIDVKFKLLDEKGDEKKLITKVERYVCAVSNDVLSNSTPCVVLRPSGAVVTQECVDKLIRKDMLDPISGKKLTESDIIPINRGGSGFAGSGVQLVSKKVTPAMIS